MENPKKYTVLLLYPDYIASDYGQETYLAHVEAHSANGAVLVARNEVAGIYGETHGSDFYVLLVIKGHHNDLNPER